MASKRTGITIGKPSTAIITPLVLVRNAIADTMVKTDDNPIHPNSRLVAKSTASISGKPRKMEYKNSPRRARLRKYIKE